MSGDKHYIGASELLEDSYHLAIEVMDSGFEPDLLLGIWRGGTPVAIAMHELMSYCGRECEHGVVKTSHYTDLDVRDTRVRTWGLEVYAQQIRTAQHLLLVDDVFDTGLSIAQVISDIESLCQDNLAEIRVAAPWYKPQRNQTDREPDYYLHQTGRWLVFPHELCGLSDAEIASNKPENSTILALLKKR